MPALQVKDCPADVYESLRRCAARENRSISQQALTIIEEYLDHRESSQNGRYSSSSTRGNEKVDYIAKRKRIFKELEKLPPIPVSELAPSSDVLLAEIRAEEAR